MKTNFNIFIASMAILFMAVSCGGGKGSSVDSALAQIEKAMDKVDKNKTSMTEADWQALSAELEGPAQVLSDALDNDQVSLMKKLKITAVMVRYGVVAAEAAMYTIADPLKEQIEELHLADSVASISNQIKEALESDEMKQALQEAAQEVQKAAEELQKVVE